MFPLPANVQDLVDNPAAQKELLKLWTSDYMGAYVKTASRSPNYVDPRVELPVGSPVKVPWNGFPRLISRWADDESSNELKERAEEIADVVTPIVSWVAPTPAGLELFHSVEHRLPVFGRKAQELGRPLRRVNPDGTLGAPVSRVRRQQDEYVEWHATRDAEGRLTRLTFSAEPPDYWFALWEISPERVVKLYQELTGEPGITKADLEHTLELAAYGEDAQGQRGWYPIGVQGTYNELNPWTTTHGLVHLTHRANTLGAEVNLAADASRVWDSAGTPAEVQRIACGLYGGINRSSDPLIGHGVGKVVAGGKRITLTDPVGLYIARANLAGLRGPNGEPVGQDALHVVRGSNDPFDPRILRFEVRLPPGKPFTLGECTFDGRLLKRGGQIARQVTVHLYANVYPDRGDATPQACGGHVCEHPDRGGLYLAQRAGNPCPARSSERWLLQTPLEQVPAPGPAGLVAEAPTGELNSDQTLVQPPLLAVQRGGPLGG